MRKRQRKSTRKSVRIAEPKIRVGIITEGVPELERFGVTTRVGNLLIGESFHWQQTMPAIFEGTFYRLATPQGNIHIVNELPLERYLRSVTGSEMNPNAPLEFLKAHAIISRSWAMGKILHQGKDSDEGKVDEPELLVDWMDAEDHMGFDVCSDDHCQRYQGIAQFKPGGDAAAMQRVLRAVSETRGLVLTDRHGKVVDARFSKCCGGRTEKFSTCWSERSVEYLRPLYDPYCDLTEMDADERKEFLDRTLKDYDHELADPSSWEVRVAKRDISRWVRDKFGRDLGDVTEVEIAEKNRGGHVKMLKITGTGGVLTVGKELMVRRALSESHLYSSLFTIEDAGDEIIIHGHGWGHGVGLCQIGAARMAELNYNYRDILEFYYPHTKLTKIYE